MWKRHGWDRKCISYLSAGSLDLSLRNVYSHPTVKHQNNFTTGTMERQLEFRRILDGSTYVTVPSPGMGESAPYSA